MNTLNHGHKPTEMTNNKQQTAVEWFDEKTFNQIELLKHLCINEEQFRNNMLIFREQAKEMEKERMIKFCFDWFISKEKNIRKYYEQTYGGGEQ